MIMEFTKEEYILLLNCMNEAARAQQNILAAASTMFPIAAKISDKLREIEAKEKEEKE